MTQIININGGPTVTGTDTSLRAVVVIKRDGSPVGARSTERVTVNHAANSGVYRLTFDDNAGPGNGHSYLATINRTEISAAETTGQIFVDFDPNDANTVIVTTSNSAGAAEDHAFALYVFRVKQ
jgi:hypothetical protein